MRFFFLFIFFVCFKAVCEVKVHRQKKIKTQLSSVTVSQSIFFPVISMKRVSLAWQSMRVLDTFLKQRRVFLFICKSFPSPKTRREKETTPFKSLTSCRTRLKPNGKKSRFYGHSKWGALARPISVFKYHGFYLRLNADRWDL